MGGGAIYKCILYIIIIYYREYYLYLLSCTTGELADPESKSMRGQQSD